MPNVSSLRAEVKECCGRMFWESDMPNVSSLRAEVKECCGRMFWQSDMPNVSSLRAELKECCGRMFWESDMPNVSSLRAEVKEWQRYWRTTEPTQSSSSHNLAECLEHSDEDIFPNIRTLLGIGCTLHVGSCEAFIPLPATGQNLPTQHDGENRLSGLTLMNMNHGMEIDLETGLSNVHRKEQTENVLKLHTVSIINMTQIRCSNIITMEKAMCS